MEYVNTVTISLFRFKELEDAERQLDVVLSNKSDYYVYMRRYNGYSNTYVVSKRDKILMDMVALLKQSDSLLAEANNDIEKLSIKKKWC